MKIQYRCSRVFSLALAAVVFISSVAATVRGELMAGAFRLLTALAGPVEPQRCPVLLAKAKQFLLRQIERGAVTVRDRYRMCPSV